MKIKKLNNTDLQTLITQVLSFISDLPVSPGDLLPYMVNTVYSKHRVKGIPTYFALITYSKSIK